MALALRALGYGRRPPVVPASHRGGNIMFASVALVLGFILMTILDTALG